jgi:branched-chain amino acid transport system permease protein
MELVLQQVANGLVLGAIYALLGAGLALVFGILRVLNFAHGEFYMLGAYFVFWCTDLFKINYFVSAILTIIIVLIIGILCARFVIRRVIKIEQDSSMLATFALSMLFVNLAQLIFKPVPRGLSSPLSNPINIGSVVLTGQKILAITLAVIIFTVLFLMLSRTKWGKMIRATSQQQTAAEIVGINVQMVKDVTFVIGVFLAAVAGIVIAPILTIQPLMGQNIIMKAFAVVVIGGLGSLEGTIFGGILLGVLEALITIIVPPIWSPIIAFAIIIVTLSIRPQGLFRFKSKGA